MEPFNKLPRILIEQDADPVLLKFRRQAPELPFDEKILATNARYLNFCRNKKRIRFKDDILHRQCYTDVGDMSHLQVSLPVQINHTLLNSLLGEACKNPGFSEMMQEIRQKHYFPSIANRVCKWVMKLHTCVQQK